MSLVVEKTLAARPAPRRLKVCIATWAPFIGGAEVAAERLAQGLAEAGHAVRVVVGEDNEVLERLRRAGLDCHFSQMYLTDKRHWLRYLRARARLRRFLRSERFDIVHSNDMPTHQFVSAAARGLGMPRITHHRFPFGGEALDWMNKFGCERHLFVSHALMQDNCRESEAIRTSPRDVVYDGLAIPTLPTADERDAARVELGLPRNKTIVTFAGQIVERKGVADLLHAWSRLSHHHERAELLIIGADLEHKGKYLAEMQALAAQLNVPASFLGFQKNIPTWLTATDIAVVPSHVEPLGNATLEAMSYALPVIGGKVGGIPEMVVHEQTGLLVPPRSPDQLAAAIERLLQDTAFRQSLGAKARVRCEEKFSLAAHVASTLEQYEQVLTGRERTLSS